MPRTTSSSSRSGARTVLVAGLVGLVALLAACSKPTPNRTELVEALQRTGLTAAESRCVSDAVLDTLSKDQVALLVERGRSGAPVDAAGETDGPLTKVRAALSACQVRTATTTTTLPEGTTATTAPVITERLDPTTTTTTTSAGG